MPHRKTSKTDSRQAGRKARVTLLIRQGKPSEAAAYAAKNGLSDWLQAVLAAGHNQSYVKLDAVAPQLQEQHSPTLPPLTQAVVAPGGAGVAGSGSSGDGDESSPKCENPQWKIGPYGEPEGICAIRPKDAKRIQDAYDLAAWLSIENEEPELYAALKADARCALLTEASALGPQSDGPETRARVSGSTGQKLPVESEGTLPSSKAAYPEEDEAVMVRELPNRLLCLIRLSDGRQVSMWRGGRKWTPKQGLRVRIDKRDGDVIYKAA